MEEFDNNQQSEQGQNFDITGLLLSYLANWKWFAISVAVCLICGFFYIKTTVPVYDVQASIYLNVQEGADNNPFNMGGAADALVAMKTYIDETELEVMKSKNNLAQIVDSLKLNISYRSKGLLRNMPLYGNNPVSASMDSATLASFKYIVNLSVKSLGDGRYNVKAKSKNTEERDLKESKNFDNIVLPAEIVLDCGVITLTENPEAKEPLDGTEYIQIVSTKNAAKSIAKNLSIDFVKKSDKIVNISCKDTDRDRGIDIIEAIVDFYNIDIIRDKNRAAVQTEAFIIDRLIMINDELKDVENRLQAYRQANNIADAEAQAKLNMNLQSTYEKDRAEVQAKIAIMDEIEKLISQANTYQTLPSVVDNPTLTTVIETYNTKVSRYNRIIDSSTPENPLVVQMEQELNRDKAKILQTIKSAKSGLETEMKSIAKLENRRASQLANTPSIDKGLQEIFREQEVKVNIYSFLLQRREEIALQKTMATNTARLIDDPEAEHPISPRKLLIMAAALLLGLAIPACIILMRRILFPVFTDQEELERLTKVPVLGEICKNTQTDKNIVVGKNDATSVAELFRLLRNNITFTRGGKGQMTILVTSSVPGEGKTFIATNLALTYALSGKKVCVVGADLRRPMLAHNFGLTNRAGVTTYLCGQENDINKLIIQYKGADNLYVLPAGPVPPNPNELIMSDRMTTLIDTLKGEFDIVIIDSAPIGLVSDSYLLAQYTDLQLYVTRAGFSSNKSLNVLHSAVASGKLPSAYIVLNDVNINSGQYVYRKYGDYGAYGRKNHTYGYGYNNQQTKK